MTGEAPQEDVRPLPPPPPRLAPFEPLGPPPPPPRPSPAAAPLGAGQSGPRPVLADDPPLRGYAAPVAFVATVLAGALLLAVAATPGSPQTVGGRAVAAGETPRSTPRPSTPRPTPNPDPTPWNPTLSPPVTLPPSGIEDPLPSVSYVPYETQPTVSQIKVDPVMRPGTTDFPGSGFDLGLSDTQRRGYIEQIPGAYRQICDDAPVLKGQVAAFRCRASEFRSVYYEFYTSKAVMRTAWRRLRDRTGLEPGTVRCLRGIAGEGAWPVARDVPAKGRVMCFDRQGGSEIVFTEDARLVRVWVVTGYADMEGTWDRFENGDLNLLP